MIIHPTLEQLVEKADIRFNVVVAVSKRTRQIQSGFEVYYEGNEKNALTIATHEILSGAIQCKTIDVFGE